MEHLASKYPSLSVTQFKAVVALANGASQGAAARAAGVHRDTIYEWRNTNPEFVFACTDARFLAVHDLMEDLKQLSREAIDSLREVIRDKNASSASRVRASIAVLKRLEGTMHEGWALPQPVREADHLETEREFLHRDYVRTENRQSKQPVPAPQNPAKSVTKQNFPQLDSEPLDPELIAEILPPIPCGCGSGIPHAKCCLPKQLKRAYKTA